MSFFNSAKRALFIVLNPLDNIGSQEEKTMTKKYYKVIAKCGHVGKRRYVPIAFAIKANSRHEASQLVRTFPRVKKQLDDAIISCENISKRQYKDLRRTNNQNPYLRCKTHKDQLAIANLQQQIHVNERHYYHKKKVEPPLSYKYRKFKEELGRMVSSNHYYGDEYEYLY